MTASLDPRVIERVEEILYFYQGRLGWYPLFDFESGFRPSYGLKLFYRDIRFGASVKGEYSSSAKWVEKVEVTYKGTVNYLPVKVSLSTRQTEDDDRVFTV